jgi:riboflavin synthase
MFTGIVEETGTVLEIQPGEKSIGCVVKAVRCLEEAKLGDSVAVNGCCLTVVGINTTAQTLRFDLLQETWDRTSFADLQIGSMVNLERAMRMSDRFGGHFVSGHIDGTGRIAVFEKRGSDFFLQIEAPHSISKYAIEKGSFAVDGISLTVASVRGNLLEFWIIPHTSEVTNLKARKPDDLVNLEPDLLGKYVERFVTAKGP